MEDPEGRPGFIVVPTMRQRLTKRWRAIYAWLVRMHDLARSWSYTANVVIVATASVLVIVLFVVLPDGALSRLAVSIWLGVIIWQAVIVIRKRQLPERNEGGATMRPVHAHGDVVTEFTLRSGILEKDEVVSYDSRPHWGYATGQLFQASSLIAVAIAVASLLTPWTTIDPLLVLLKVVGILGAVYWLGRQEADYLWTHYIVSDRYTHVISRPWAIFGAERTFSLKLTPIETRDIHRPMIFRLLRMDMGHMEIDAPGQKDQRFNDLRWVRSPKEFRRLLKPGMSEEPVQRGSRWRRPLG